MAIIITDQYKLRQANFLDDRKGLASSVSALKSWDFEKVPIPEGFEVYTEGIWYIYKSSNSVDPVSGKFRTRGTDQGLDGIEAEIEALHKEDRKLEFDNTRDHAAKFSDILSESFWKDEDGVSHVRPGRIVVVTGDGANNGSWYLTNSNYSSANSWIKLLDRTDIESLDSSDTKIYGTKKADSIFPKKAGTETISGSWTFTENSVFTKNLSVTGELKSGSHDISGDLEVTGKTDIGGNTSIGGNATITGGTSIGGDTSIGGNATITGTTSIGGDSTISGSASIGRNIDVTGNSKIHGSSEVLGNEVVGGNISISGSSNVTGNTTTGSLTVKTNSEVRGNSKVDGTENIGGDLNVTGKTNIGGNTTISGSLTVEGYTKQGDTEFSETGNIKTIDGKTIATFDKLVAEDSEIGNIDEVVEEKLGLIGVGNLLKNTSLRGQYNSKYLDNDTSLYGTTNVYSDIKEDWNITTSEIQIIPEEDSITGFAFSLPIPNARISQVSAVNLIDGASYVLSWKQKGSVVVEVDNYDLDIKKVNRSAVSGYDCYYAKFDQLGTRKVEVKFNGGPGYVCEIKLEEGIIPTTWFPSLLDTDPVADEIHDYEYLRTAFTEYKNDGLVSSLFLNSQVKVGEHVDGDVENISGGLSGVFTDPKDTLFWSGSDYEDAQRLVSDVIKNPNFLDDLSYSELQSLTKAVITMGSRSIFTDLYAHGKLVGEFKGDGSGNFSGVFRTTSGEKLYNYHGLGGYVISSVEDPTTGEESSRRLNFRDGATYWPIQYDNVVEFDSTLYVPIGPTPVTGNNNEVTEPTLVGDEGISMAPSIGGISDDNNEASGNGDGYSQDIGEQLDRYIIEKREHYYFKRGLCYDLENLAKTYTGWKPLYNVTGSNVPIHYLYFNAGYLVRVSTEEPGHDNSNWY